MNKDWYQANREIHLDGVMGIGKTGSGKTTTFTHWANQLQERANVPIIWFNPKMNNDIAEAEKVGSVRGIAKKLEQEDYHIDYNVGAEFDTSKRKERFNEFVNMFVKAIPNDPYKIVIIDDAHSVMDAEMMKYLLKEGRNALHIKPILLVQDGDDVHKDYKSQIPWDVWTGKPSEEDKGWYDYVSGHGDLYEWLREAQEYEVRVVEEGEKRKDLSGWKADKQYVPK